MPESITPRHAAVNGGRRSRRRREVWAGRTLAGSGIWRIATPLSGP
jgi:hypothetical protein